MHLFPKQSIIDAMQNLNNIGVSNVWIQDTNHEPCVIGIIGGTSSSKLSMFTDLCRSHVTVPMSDDGGPEPPSPDIGFVASPA